MSIALSNCSRLAMTIAAAILALGLPAEIRASSITINSSGSVTFLDSGNTSTDFSSLFTPADFAAAQTGSAAFVISSNPAWIDASAIPGADWIGPIAGADSTNADTALYAASFVLPSGFSSASLSILYAVDNALGDLNAGIFLNGVALPSSTGIPCGVGNACGGSFNVVNTYSDANVTSLLNSGTNWIYFDAVNLGGPGGLIFSADLTYTLAGVPEPSMGILTALGIAVMVFWKRRSARASA